MLTADLALSWQRGEEIRPRRLNPSDPRWLRDAAALVRLFAEHAGRERGELEQALDGYVGAGTNYKVFRGLIKLLLDRSEFENAAGLDPPALRRALFLRARESHPLDGGEEARARVVSEVARELDCEPAALAAGLYADLPRRQRLTSFEEIDARELIDLYNLAQAQALLYRCVRMSLRVRPQPPEGQRRLFGAIKAHRLIHAVRGGAAEGYEVLLDGPVSIFHRSQKYGVQMSVFLPDLLACDGWSMRAEIATRRGAALFALDSQSHDLRSPQAGLRGYENPVREKLLEAWPRFDTDWTLEPSGEVIDLGDSAFVPDFILRHPAGQSIHLELLGFWTPEHLTERLAEFERAGLKNFLLAAWEELRGSRDPFTRDVPQVVLFKRTLDPAAVEWAAEKLVIREAQAQAQSHSQ
jgi:uncharacterized protein